MNNYNVISYQLHRLKVE